MSVLVALLVSAPVMTQYAPAPQPQPQPQPQYAPPPAYGPQQPPPAYAPAPGPAAGGAPAQSEPALDAQPKAEEPPVDAAPKKSPLDGVPLKLLSKVGSGAAYAVWVVLWAVAVPVYGLGLFLLGLSTSPAMAGNATGMIGGGAVLMGLATLVLLLGGVALAAAVGLGITTTVLQTLQPDAQAADNPVSGFIPRTLLL